MNDFAILKKFHSILRPFVGVFVLAIFFDVVMTLIGLAPPLFMRLVFDYAYPFRDITVLNLAVVSIIVAYFLYFFISVASDYLQIYVHQEASASLTEKVFRTICLLPLKLHREKKSGDLLNRVTEDVGKTVSMVANAIPTIVVDGGRLVVILAIALYINPKLTLLAMLSIPLYIFETKFYAKRLARVEKDSIDADSAIYTRVTERFSSIKTIKAFGQEDHEALCFGTLVMRRYRIGIKGRLLDVMRAFTNSVTLQLWGVFLIWFLGYQVVTGRLSIGEVVALMLYFEQMGDPVKSLVDLATEWKTNVVSMRRVDEILTAPSEEKSDTLGNDVTIQKGEIITSGLTFAYTPQSTVLHDIDVHFHPSSVTAIVGSSGSGKTTLVDLLLRFFDPTRGIIFVDGHNISEIKVHSLRGQIGIVSQDTNLFDGSIVDNILYGNENLDRGDAMRVAKLAGAADFIERLPGGYDTEVGVGGCLLSPGQRQRIAIARVLLRSPSVVIFDEVTSALDPESEYKIHEIMMKLKATKTVIVIAHRLSTIKAADNILVLEDGKFVEEGTFDMLMEERGAFYKFYWRQFGGLKSFHMHLTMELERTARYGSKFCVAVLKLKNFGALEKIKGIDAADEYSEIVDLSIKKHIRIGDDCAKFSGDTILMLLPEINDAQLAQFFDRMKRELPKTNIDAPSFKIKEDDLFFVGARVTKKLFKTPEEIISKLILKGDVVASDKGYVVYTEDELSGT